MSKVLLGDVAAERRETCKGSKDGYPTVGLEHLTPEDITLTSWDEGSDNTFTKMFLKGDVLFGRRRAYLKKAAVAPFDGICSGDITVITAKPNYLLPELLPFIIQNDTLFDFAVEKSAGSLSPRVKWEHLKNYEFSLPDMEKQHELSELLWAMDATKKSYQRLVAATDELVKSQFIEMIGPYSQYSTKAGTIMYGMRNGLSPSRAGEHYAKTLTLSAVTQGAFDENAWKDGYFADCPPNDKRICATDFYICRGNGNKTLVGAGVYSLEDRFDLVFPDTVIAARINEQKIRLPYLYMAWKMQAVRNQIEENAKTTNGTYKINQSVIANVELVVPPLPVQDEFVAFVRQSDKSKFAVLSCLKHRLPLRFQDLETIRYLIDPSGRREFSQQLSQENCNG